MPNLLDIKKRIQSVKNTQQITRAMQMVAAAKLRRAQLAALSRRPYGRKLGEVLSALVTHADVDAHPLFAGNDSKVTAIVLVTGDRGLCGGFNSNVSKRASDFYNELLASGREPKFYAIGKKGRDYVKRREYPILADKTEIFMKLDYDIAQTIADELMEKYLAGEIGDVQLVYNEFLSVMRPRILVEQLLPIPSIEAEASESMEYEFVPDPAKIFDALVPWHVRTQVWRILQESWAAELASRMTAMGAATKNAGEMIDQQTLFMNKVRQASITRELLEVVAGAAALED